MHAGSVKLLRSPATLPRFPHQQMREMMGCIEDTFATPVALVEDILLVAEKLTNGDNERAKIDVSLRSQLSRMASTHGGKVPLHGRFFAQWLHYAFPRECTFPTRLGRERCNGALSHC